MTSFGIVYPLWEHEALRGALLDRLHGEAGLDHVTIPAVTAAVEQLRLCGDEGPRPFTCEAGCHFAPNPDPYPGRSTPRAARWFGRRDVLAGACEEARRRGIAPFLRIDVRGLRRERDADSAVERNAWGRAPLDAAGCPSSPFLRELLAAVIADLGRYAPSGIELDGLMQDDAADGVDPLSWSPELRALARCCFCASCREIAGRAGVDADQAARSVRVRAADLMERAVDDGEPATDRPGDERIDEYAAAVAADRNRWLAGLAGAIAARGRFVLAPAGRPALQGGGAGRRETRPEGWDILIRVRRIGAAEVGGLRDGLQARRAAGFLTPCWRPAVREASELVQAASEGCRAGAQVVEFEGVEEAPTGVGAWIRQAVRMARRG